MTSDVSKEIPDLNDPPDDRDKRLERRIAALYADDPQFRAAEPNSAVIEAARRPGPRLAETLQTLAVGYGSRPALGERAREVTTDPITGRATARLLPTFDTTSYHDLWAQVRAIATAWRNDPDHRVSPGDFVATVGFASPDYLKVDLVCAYLGLVSVPLQHNAPASRLQPIIAEAAPRVVAVSAEYLDLAVESGLHIASLRQPADFDYPTETG